MPDEYSKKCPNCGNECSRDEVDVGVGVIYGPWGCSCGWSEEDAYNLLDGPKFSENGKALDQYGRCYPSSKKG